MWEIKFMVLEIMSVTQRFVNPTSNPERENDPGVDNLSFFRDHSKCLQMRSGTDYFIFLYYIIILFFFVCLL